MPAQPPLVPCSLEASTAMEAASLPWPTLALIFFTLITAMGLARWLGRARVVATPSSSSPSASASPWPPEVDPLIRRRREQILMRPVPPPTPEVEAEEDEREKEKKEKEKEERPSAASASSASSSSSSLPSPPPSLSASERGRERYYQSYVEEAEQVPVVQAGYWVGAPQAQAAFPALAPRPALGWDWNARFQDSLARTRRLTPTSSLASRVAANLELMHLAQDFIGAAVTYGKVIISEAFLPPEQQTIRPVSLGGLMGGPKYLVHRILFKFATDHSQLFGSDYAAAKVAGNELRGLISYFNCGQPELGLPLMALVDYRGFRLVALSLLPVDASTLVYGSCDAGRSFQLGSQPALEALMLEAARRLNLQPHHCRVARRPNAPPPAPSPALALKRPLSRSSPPRPAPSPATPSLSPAVLLRVPPRTASPSPSPPSSPSPSPSPSLANSASGYDTALPPEDKEKETTELLYSAADLEGHLGHDERY